MHHSGSYTHNIHNLQHNSRDRSSGDPKLRLQQLPRNNNLWVRAAGTHEQLPGTISEWEVSLDHGAFARAYLLSSAKSRKFIGSDGQQYRWSWRTTQSEEWTVRTNSHVRFQISCIILSAQTQAISKLRLIRWKYPESQNTTTPLGACWPSRRRIPILQSVCTLLNYLAAQRWSGVCRDVGVLDNNEAYSHP